MSMLEVDYGWYDFRKLNVDNSKLRKQNAKLREYVEWLEDLAMSDPNYYRDTKFLIEMKRRELGIEEE